jgi:hypothetical protein
MFLAGLLVGGLLVSAASGVYVLKMGEGPQPSVQKAAPSVPVATVQPVAPQVAAVQEPAVAPTPPQPESPPVSDKRPRVICDLRPPPPPTPLPPEAFWHQARARFIDGDQRGAVALAKSCASKVPVCKSGLKDLTEFGKLYAKREDLDARGLKRLLDLDKKITGELGPSKMTRNASARMANLFYKMASASRAAGQWARAVEYARLTLQADPQHAGAPHILSELRAKAREMYLGIYAPHRFENDPEAALQIFRDVIAMTPPEDELHQRAKKWLEQLER